MVKGTIAHVRGSMSLAMAAAKAEPQLAPELTKQPESKALMENPPLRLSIDPNSPDYHPCYTRVGVRVNGEERNDLQFYDVKRLEILTVDRKSSLVESIEPYWRRSELRNERRWRERWEAKRRIS